MKINQPRLTLLGRSLFLVVGELLANAICWIAAGLIFGRSSKTQPSLSLALLAWTVGLRHGKQFAISWDMFSSAHPWHAALDADHISAIDNATRGLIALGKLPVTCGLWFSLGHSTIVIVVNVAIAVGTDFSSFNHLSSVGGILGAAVSGSFLFLVGLANSIILWKILKKRRKFKKTGEALEEGSHNTIMLKILGPVIKFVNAPWKMYIVGILFGFGFDTASSIALLSISVIAKDKSSDARTPSMGVTTLQLLFTAGMSLIDSLDSILMLYSYTGFPERSWTIFARDRSQSQMNGDLESKMMHVRQIDERVVPEEATLPSPERDQAPPSIREEGRELPLEDYKSEVKDIPGDEGENMVQRRNTVIQQTTMSNLSLILTLMSIIVAFSVSIITIMALIGENCRSCRKAAHDPHSGDLAGRWWRTWAKADDNSGYIGAAIVGMFVTTVFVWYGSRYATRCWSRRRVATDTR
ncbi:hypothetical protein PUNSTDRAFT_60012 [Punctularia strigosozonata HHB-11173 SS5]|uniref:uncharacterized protein n=1 Tax=Punctularia strigosozonata (strain HHB-11173) TaxID=741275 RepID=UPI0004416CA1|nr:uncharacterized protein PUNSTDRAFT_60012 [Punctularia strigosozonata HHB-11173 SS5]EIN12727.1 hypothetical protein PUNSTDRAFT_60012 [Punctularia strigosozonata HHB-11173 SS5]